MIYVVEPDVEHPGHWLTRAVGDRGEKAPASLGEIRLALTCAIKDLPSRVDRVVFIADRRRPADGEA